MMEGIDNHSRHQVGLELVEIDVETTIETEGSGDTGDNLRDQTVDIDETRCGNAETLLANVSDRLIIDHERAVRVLESGVGRQDCIVRLNDGGGHLGSRVDTELELGFLAIVGRKSLEKQSSETGTSSSTEGVEDEEALQTSAVVCQATCLVHNCVDHLFANGVMSTSIWLR